MNIIAHRGFWQHPNERNTITAFQRALSSGYGIETDLRDSQGKIVISHDIPAYNCMDLKDFFDLYNQYNGKPLLALNIKSDGLQELLQKEIIKFNIQNYFVFDMSIPDFKCYLDFNFQCYTRKSEYEKNPSFINNSKGIWFDEFIGNWITKKDLHHYKSKGLEICIVSPELHGRKFENEWKIYKEFEKSTKIELNICTDFPEKARRYFNE